ncbi:MAG: alpha/beta hydrolase [Bdellovibrionales bacterium RIFCSPHIGHO2_01_FULL_40_29]|nr:MAG: alpha/beta hydrolase [Bdellovibrionales bacterium RIFCSPHIGHO2_01_FULL_40_29]OFZ34659.1 MAG: alpha/beta hydrolase [Bdellovibrionales bacterium RIFCSPHIGHO2_02_FULL_40_15]
MTDQNIFIEKKTGTYKAFDGTPIYYEVRGHGEPIVFIYGIACLMNHWHHQVEHFAKTHQVILFDIRGHHKSTPVVNMANLKLEHLAFDLKGLLNHLGHKKAHFVGHSFGGPYILKTYEQFPEIFSSMILINAFSRNPLKKLFGLEFVEPLFNFVREQHRKSPDLWNTLWRGLIDNPIAFQIAALAGGFNIRLTQFKDIEMYGRGVSRLELPIFFELFEQLLEYDGRDTLSTVSCPALILAGERDLLTPPSYQVEMNHLIHGSELMKIPYGSHCSQLDFPEFVNLKISEFLRRAIEK